LILSYYTVVRLSIGLVISLAELSK
jgi:hypothetical protein